MSYKADKANGLVSSLIFPIGIFAIVGTGVGLTAAILMAVLGGGSAIFSGLTVLIVIAVSLLLGPIVASIVGIQMSDREHGSMPVGSIFGCSIGFIIMMFVVLLMLFIGVAITSMGGTGAGTTSPTAGGSSSGGGFDVTQYLLPIILVTVPTGLAGGAASYLNSRFGFSSSTDDAAGKNGATLAINIPTKYVIGGIMG